MAQGIEAWFFDGLPQPVFAAATFLALVVAAALGRAARQFRSLAHPLGSTQEGYVVSAVLGLLALLVGFTFAMAVERFDTRRSLVSEEASAITSTYLLAQTLDMPHRAHVTAILLEYLDNRIALGHANDAGAAAALTKANNAMQQRLWAASLAAVTSVRDDISSSYLSSAEGMIGTGEERIIARRSHIPWRVYTVLFSYMIITAAVMGYAFAGSPLAVTNGTLFVLLTLCMVLILDLDRPVSGSIIESQSPMELVRERLRGASNPGTTSTPESSTLQADADVLTAGQPVARAPY